MQKPKSVCQCSVQKCEEVSGQLRAVLPAVSATHLITGHFCLRQGSLLFREKLRKILSFFLLPWGFLRWSLISQGRNFYKLRPDRAWGHSKAEEKDCIFEKKKSKLCNFMSLWVVIKIFLMNHMIVYWTRNWALYLIESTQFCSQTINTAQR